MEDISPFFGTTDTPVLDFWCRLPPGFKARVDPLLHASSPACNGFIGFTSGLTAFKKEESLIHKFSFLHRDKTYTLKEYIITSLPPVNYTGQSAMSAGKFLFTITTTILGAKESISHLRRHNSNSGISLPLLKLLHFSLVNVIWYGFFPSTHFRREFGKQESYRTYLWRFRKRMQKKHNRSLALIYLIDLP